MGPCLVLPTTLGTASQTLILTLPDTPGLLFAFAFVALPSQSKKKKESVAHSPLHISSTHTPISTSALRFSSTLLLQLFEILIFRLGLYSLLIDPIFGHVQSTYSVQIELLASILANVAKPHSSARNSAARNSRTISPGPESTSSFRFSLSGNSIPSYLEKNLSNPHGLLSTNFTLLSSRRSFAS
jgi:hypothetical protein